MNKILFLEEFEKTNEVPMLVRTLPVGEPHISGDIMRQRQRGTASRTQQHLRESRFGGRRVLTDILHQFQRGPWGDLQVFVLVEPEGLARGAYFDSDRDAQTAVKRPVGHRNSAIRALHNRMVSRREKGGTCPPGLF